MSSLPESAGYLLKLLSENTYGVKVGLKVKIFFHNRYYEQTSNNSHKTPKRFKNLSFYIFVTGGLAMR